MCLVYVNELKQQVPNIRFGLEKFGDYPVARLPERMRCGYRRDPRREHDAWAYRECDEYRLSFCTACAKEGRTNALCYKHLDCKYHGFSYSIPDSYLGVWQYPGCWPRIEGSVQTQGFNLFNLDRMKMKHRLDWEDEMKEADPVAYPKPEKVKWVCAFTDDPTGLKIFWQSILKNPELLLLHDFHRRDDPQVSHWIEYDAIVAMSTYGKDRCVRNHHRMQSWLQKPAHRHLPLDMIVYIFEFFQPTLDHMDPISAHPSNRFILPNRARLKRYLFDMMTRYDD